MGFFSVPLMPGILAFRKRLSFGLKRRAGWGESFFVYVFAGFRKPAKTGVFPLLVFRAHRTGGNLFKMFFIPAIFDFGPRWAILGAYL